MIKKKREEFFYKNCKSINKCKLVDLVNKKLPQVKRKHVNDIIHIFFEQIQNDLFKDKIIEIGNFIKFSLHRMPEKKGRSYYTGEIITTKAFNKLQVSLNSRLSKKLMKYFDTSSDEKE